MSGGVLSNPVTGERIILQSAKTDRSRLQMQVAPGGARPPVHLHCRIAESFEVVEGALTLLVDGAERILGPGDAEHVAPGVAHTWWNSGDGTLRFNAEFKPAGNMRSFFETLCGLAAEGRMSPSGDIAFLQIVASAPHWDTYLAGPPLLAQRVLFSTLAPLAWALGYRARYPRFDGSLAPVPQNPTAIQQLVASD
jgi:quercetin dioxygenase-like cupin family protein